MSSIIEGYNYDIFISYRQKDNKGDRWVSEFVDALKDELESTFKEEISVYFDINPHDGLLETHDVDESLKDKLKCLIFIPIISRTYCDPRSFAWEHEFKAFVEQASKDLYGLKVKLPNGNVASRILPVQIHDLDKEDISMCESVIGSILRGIEFIYKEPGVNKPLTDDDDEKKNLNGTKYKIQINKVANAIKEVIMAIEHYSPQKEEMPQEIIKPMPTSSKKKKTGLIVGSFIALAVIILGILFVPKLFKTSKVIEKSIAVLPFKSLSDDPEKQYLADGVMDAILLHLSKIEDLRVMSRTSVEQYRETDKTSSVIGRELNVAYILEGSFQKYGDYARLIVQLIKTGEEGHVWANDYDRNWNDILLVQSEVAKSIASELHTVITPEEEITIDEKPTNDLIAYDFYLRGNDYLKRSYEEEDMRYALQMYGKAVEIDPDFTLAWVGLSECSRTLFWWSYNKFEENLSRAKEYLDKACTLSPRLKAVRLEEARYYYQCERNYAKSLQILEELKTEYSKDAEIFTWIGYVYRRMGEFRKSLEYSELALSLDPYSWDLSNNAAITNEILRKYGEAEKYYKKAIELNPSNTVLYNNLINLFITSGQILKVKDFLSGNEKFFDPSNLDKINAKLEFLARNYEEAIQITQKLTKIEFISQESYDTKHLQLGLMYSASSDNDLAIRNFEIARDTILKKINYSKNDRRLYMSLGIACAGMDLKEEALDAGRKAMEILNLTNDTYSGYFPEMNMVRILVLLGDYNEAMKRLEKIINYTGFITVEILKLDPFWDPVRNNAKFIEIVNNPEYRIDLSQ